MTVQSYVFIKVHLAGGWRLVGKFPVNPYLTSGATKAAAETYLQATQYAGLPYTIEINWLPVPAKQPITD